MNLFNVVIVPCFSNCISVFSRGDGGDFGTGGLEVPVENQLAPLCGSGNEGIPLRNKTCVVTEYRHYDGNTYLIGVDEKDERKHDFALIVDFIKGNRSSAFRWI